MKTRRTNTSLVPMLMAMCSISIAQLVSADVEMECRQEADEYGVMPELRDDYITGCVDSRGGMGTSASGEEDYMPPSESDEVDNTEEDYMPPSESDEVDNTEEDSDYATE